MTTDHRAHPWPADLFAGRRYAVVGLGRNGLPAARTLIALGAEVVAWDDQPAARAEAAGLPIADPSAGRYRPVRCRGVVARHPTSPARPAPDRGSSIGSRRAGAVGCGIAVPGGAAGRRRGALCGHHRHQRQIHHHQPAGASAALCRASGGGGRQSGAGGARTRTAAGQRHVCAGNVVLHARTPCHDPLRGGGDAEPVARPSGPAWRYGGLCRGQARGVRPAAGGRPFGAWDRRCGCTRHGQRAAWRRARAARVGGRTRQMCGSKTVCCATPTARS